MFRLQWYISRELLKTFALTAIGLTLTFSLCGGALNIIQTDVLTAVQLAQLLGFILPVATTLTLPIAALFACAMVYGRLAADNEFDACKSSGVNIHRLLLPAFLLSIFTALFTFSFTNYVIPEYIKQLDEMVRADLQKIVFNKLKSGGVIPYRSKGYVLYAGDTQLITGKHNRETIYIGHAAFMDLEGDNLVEVGTANEVWVDFTSPEGGQTPMIQAIMHNVRALDIERNRFYYMERQPINPIPIPPTVEMEAKWLGLNELFYYVKHLTELPDVREKAQNLRQLVRDNLFYKQVINDLKENNVFVIKDGRYRYEIKARQIKLPMINGKVDKFKPTLVDVIVKSRHNNRTITYKADSCEMETTQPIDPGQIALHLRLEGNVRFSDPDNPGNVVETRSQELQNVMLPSKFDEKAKSISDDELFGANLPPGQELPSLGVKLGEDVKDKRIGMHKQLALVGLEINSIIHSRLAFSASVLVTLILAASLAVIIRGGQLLTAFVIAFIPGIFIVVMNIMGRQMAEKPETALVGIVIIWAAIGLVALTNLVVLGKYLKR